MNKERLTKLREQLLSIPGKFDYSCFGVCEIDGLKKSDYSVLKSHPCQTSACVAGWCVLLNDLSTDFDSMWYSARYAANYLDLTHEEKRFLFFPTTTHGESLGYDTSGEDGSYDYESYTLQDALRRIDFLLSDSYTGPIE